MSASQGIWLALLVAMGCGPTDSAPGSEDAPATHDAETLQARAAETFGTLPAEVPSPKNPFSEEKIKLGRMLYYDARISQDQEASCNTCHPLDRHGVDGEPSSRGHGGVGGERNAPTVYNAALHVAQFWDGRAPDVEAAQAVGAREKAVEETDTPSEDAVAAVLASIPGYGPLFHAAFPGDDEAITRENMAKAIGAFERKLMTPGTFDAFLAGDTSALTESQLAGLDTFISTGCVTCHQGPTVGGGMFRKLGLVKPYGTVDPGRFAVTGKESDRAVFKVPSLRNVAQTAPYFHDGSVETLDEAIRIMGEHQLGVTLEPSQVASIRTFLQTLTGGVDPLYTGRPELPESGPDAPAPDAS